MNNADNVSVNIVAKWPGSTHDSFIFRTSNIRQYLEENHTKIEDGLILGDSGYALSRYLMTPYSNPVTRAERRYNVAHKTTRCSVERSIGQLKRRFGCLETGLRRNPKNCCVMIIACVVLHNIAKQLNEEDFDIDDLNYLCNEIDNNAYNPHGNEPGRMVREHITTTFFS